MYAGEKRPQKTRDSGMTHAAFPIGVKFMSEGLRPLLSINTWIAEEKTAFWVAGQDYATIIMISVASLLERKSLGFSGLGGSVIAERDAL